jgi:hypothetical protein
MKKVALSLVMGVMLLASTITVQAKTVDTSKSSTIAPTTNSTIYHLQSENPTGW